MTQDAKRLKAFMTQDAKRLKPFLFASFAGAGKTP